MVVKCLPTFTFHFPARIGAMAPALALMPLGGRRPAQRTGTDRNDAPARDTYAKSPDPSPGHLCSIENFGDTYAGAAANGAAAKA